MIPARRSDAPRTLTEMVVVTPLLVYNARSRTVPVDATSAIGTVVMALVPANVTTISVIAPVQFPSVSDQLPAQR